MKNLLSKIKGLVIVLLLITGANQVFAQEFMIASAAGYKKPVMAVIESFENETDINVDAVYGNIQMVASQAKQTGEISCIIGDKKFLKKLGETVQFKDYYPLGKGILVLAYRKGVEINSIEDIITDKVESVFMPQDGKAIYGIAGTEALKAYGYTEKIQDKLTQVATIPQVVSYLLTGEADAGFINLTEALANKDKLGGYILVPEDKYTEIIIVAGAVAGFEQGTETKEFISFIQSDKALSIFKEYGL